MPKKPAGHRRESNPIPVNWEYQLPVPFAFLGYIEGKAKPALATAYE